MEMEVEGRVGKGKEKNPSIDSDWVGQRVTSVWLPICIFFLHSSCLKKKHLHLTMMLLFDMYRSYTQVKYLVSLKEREDELLKICV